MEEEIKDATKVPLNTTKVTEYGSTAGSSGYNGSNRKKTSDATSVYGTKSGLVGLFRYASKTDIVLMCTGILFSTVHGASFPVLALVFGQMTNTFIIQATQGFKTNVTDSVLMSGASTVTSTVSYSASSSWGDGSLIAGPLTPAEFTAYMGTFSMYYFFIGVGVLIAAFIQTLCWELSSERQVYCIRKMFISQILRQDITWFDLNDEGDLSTKLSDDVERIREGIGSKFSIVTQYVATFVSGIVVGVTVNWRLTAFLLLVGPLLIGTSAYMAKVTASSAAREQLKYSLAGGIADEALTCVRTVAAFGGEKREVTRYAEALDKGRRLAMKKYYVLSIGLAFYYLILYASYGLAFWYGTRLIEDGYTSPGGVFTVFFSVMSGAFSLGNALPFVTAVSTAIGAASTVFAVIDRIPDIDPYSYKGLTPFNFGGHVHFENVRFSYPARPQVEVLKGLNLDIEPGKKVALVGSSGAGKSTVVSLILRFYDVSTGVITMDGNPIQDLSLYWLRKQVGVVSQEPVLFGVSIAENIRYGREDATQDDIEMAATMANVHGFIDRLPQGYETLVGDRGAQLSGGQKQRIAIARALVRDPKILLLDEATSALDAYSEAVVQEALERAMHGRTTVIIAHRLSTVKNADVICAMKDGVIVEKGTHDELMELEGLYYRLVETQTVNLMSNSYPTSEDITDDSEAGPLVLRRKKSRTLSDSRTLPSLYEDPGINVLKKETEDTDAVDVSAFRLLRLNTPECGWLLFGLLGCAVLGSVTPVFAFFYGEVFATFTLTGDELRKAAMFWSTMFALLACISALAAVLQIVCMSMAAEKLVMRVRLLAFTNIMRQPVAWFDMDKNSAGKLITRLARDAPIIKGAAGLRAGQVISSAVTLASALTIAFLFGWKLATLLLAAVPVIIGAAYQQTMIIRRNQLRDARFMDDAGRVASESIQNVRTVQSLGKEQLFVRLYMEYLVLPFKEAKKQAVVFAIVFSISQAVIYGMYAAAFRFGAYLIEIGDMTPTEVYRVFFALAFCASSVGQSSAYIQDYAKAKMAAALLFQLIERKSEIDATSPYGVKPELKGKVLFDQVFFHYPSRPNVEVLQGLTFTVEPGKTLALVGASGCGKSTVVALLERFYNPIHGTVLVDDIDIRLMNLQYLRSHIGLVTQEPTLFDCSIKENIIYGLQNAESLPADILFSRVVEAAKTANIHDFVVSLPQGYDTMVGDRGTQMSGGQKQRIAIARALIRDPKILLLDEATSALDVESEKIVQEALDKAREGRTCIIIAHRLSTIQNADSIAVIHRGCVIEQGTHDSLMTKHGYYYQLVKKQTMRSS